METVRTEEEKMANIVLSGIPIVGLRTNERKRATKFFYDVAKREEVGANIYTWDCFDGIRDIQTGKTEEVRNPVDFIRFVQDLKDKRSINIMFMANPALESPQFRQALDSCLDTFSSGKTLVLVDACLKIPQDTAGLVSIYDFPMPGKAEMEHVLSGNMTSINKKRMDDPYLLSQEDQNQIVEASLGLTTFAAADAMALSYRETRRIDPVFIIKEKIKRFKEEGIEFYNDPPDLSQIGGHENAKEYAMRVPLTFGDDAKAFGIEYARAVMLFGISGTGKSLLGKIFSSVLKAPLIMASLNKFKSSGYGDAESKLTAFLKKVDAIGKGVVLLDEMEKGVGSSSGGRVESHEATDGMFNIFLTWMEERRNQIFLVATCNDVEALFNTKPELFRKGRFDEIFFFDLPNLNERAEIFRIHISNVKRDPASFNLMKFAKASESFTGAEIKSVVQSALLEAFYRKHELNDEVILQKIKSTIPQNRGSKVAQRLREFAKGRAVCSSPSAESKDSGRVIE